MKRVNHVVIGTFIFTLLMAFGSPSFGAIISEEFDGPTYAFTLENFQTELAAWSVSQDTNSVLSGVNSAYMNITSSGDQWWALQVRAANIQVLASSVLSISFDIKSSAALNFDFVIEGANPRMLFPVSLAAGETKHYSFTTDEFINGGNTFFMFGLGNSTVSGSEVWLDNVQIEVVSVDLVNMPVEEEFDSAPIGNSFGPYFTLENYGAGASYTFSQDTSSLLSGTNSAYMNIASSGTEWWAIQVRLENLAIETNTIVEVSFDIKSTADITFSSRIEGPGNEPEDEVITVLAGETKSIKYQTGMMTNATTSTFLLALGNSTAGAAEVWIDKIKLWEWVPLPDIGDITMTQLSDINGLVLTWDTIEGYDYALETKSQLPYGNWETNQIVPGVDGSVTVTTAVDQAHSFYRVTSE